MHIESRHKKICSNCVGEPFLSALIKEDGETSVCYYCNNEENKCISLEVFADHIESAFERHYCRTSDQPDLYEGVLLRDNESNYFWERHGDPAATAIEEAAVIDTVPANDALKLLADRHSNFESAQMGEECEFDEDSHYESKDIEDTVLSQKFERIEHSLKSQTRFFNQPAEKFLAQLFDRIEEINTLNGRPAVVTAGPNNKINSFFRARVFHNMEELCEGLERPDTHLGPPPSKIARANRMNARGISVFYGADSPEVAIAEVRPPVGSQVLVGRFDLTRTVRLLDVEALRSIYIEGSIFDPNYVKQLELARFLQRLSQRMTMPVMPNDEHSEYLITQMIADYLARKPNPGMDGILYPSVQNREEKWNVVLFQHASRVSRMHLPAGTELESYYYRYSEDEMDTPYRVWEVVPEVSNNINSDAKVGFNSNDVYENPQIGNDSREETLRLDVETIRVHEITGATFNTLSLPVERARITKQENDAAGDSSHLSESELF